MIDKIKKIIYSLLLKSQKFTGSDNIYIAKQGSSLMVGNVVGLITSFLLSIAFARLLPEETFGQYQYILSIMTILSISALEGMNRAIIQGIAKGFEGTVLKAFKEKMRWGLLGSIASLIVGAFFLIKGNLNFAICFLIIAIFMPLLKSSELYQSYLDGKKLFTKRVIYVTVTQIVSTIALIITMFLTKNLVPLVLIYFLFYSGMRTYFLIRVVRKITDKNPNPETISYGKHLSLMGIISLVSQEINNVLIFNFIGPTQLAIYSFATLPIEHLRSPLQSIQELALPKFSTRSNDEIKKSLPKKLIGSTVIILIAISLYIILAPLFYKIFYPNYINSVFYSQLFSLTLLVFPVSIMRLYMLSKTKTKELYKLSIVNPIAKIIFLLILIPLYGLLGVVIAELLSLVFHFFTTLVFFRKM